MYTDINHSIIYKRRKIQSWLNVKKGLINNGISVRWNTLILTGVP